MKAKLVDNKPICNICGQSNFRGINSYDLVEYKGIKLFKFSRYCNNCDCEVEYYKTISLKDDDRYYDVDEKEVKAIK